MSSTPHALASLDLNLLVALNALLEEKSVSRAAQQIGLSSSALSHTLQRLRDHFDDPLLVRAGRTMVASAFAEQLAPRVKRAIHAVTDVFEKNESFDSTTLERGFRICSSDQIAIVLGREINSALTREAPLVDVHYQRMPQDIGDALRNDRADLALGVFRNLPPEILQTKLYQDRFVCLVRKNHPTVGARLTMKRYTSLRHILVSPRGRPGGNVDAVLAERNLSRRVARTTADFLTAGYLLAESDDILTVSERVAEVLCRSYPLKRLNAPLPLSGYTVRMIWHPRHHDNPAHSWFRALIGSSQVGG